MRGYLLFPTPYFSLIVYISLWLISVGNGSIRANITSLGASQFKVPPQGRELEGYFSRYYFVYTAGILLSKTVTPSIRGMTKCFGRDNCYLAVFGTLSIIFLLCFGKFEINLRIRGQNLKINFSHFSNFPHRLDFLHQRNRTAGKCPV